jgi:hypothetical protein
VQGWPTPRTSATDAGTLLFLSPADADVVVDVVVVDSADFVHVHVHEMSEMPATALLS